MQKKKNLSLYNNIITFNIRYDYSKTTHTYQ